MVDGLSRRPVAVPPGPGRDSRAMAIVDVHGLTKRYGARVAVAALDLRVEAGEVLALLGPNGAGKTTTLEILEGLRPAGSDRYGFGEQP